MVNILSARVLFLTYTSAVLTYSSGLALCPQKWFEFNYSEVFLNVYCYIDIFSLHGLSRIAFNQ